MMRGLGLGLLLCGLACGATAQAQNSAPSDIIIRSVDLQKEQLDLYWRDGHGQVLADFAALDQYVAQQGRRLQFAMNAGMFHANRAPVGLLVINGRELSPLNRASGKGNFFLQPNGVFFVDDAGQAHVMQTADYAAFGGKVRLATQSGPMLAWDGKVNPAFRPDSDSRTSRNGVCVRQGKVWLALAAKPINFYDFAQLFLQRIGCRDALYLDGAISAIYDSAQGAPSARHAFGPMLGVSSATP